MDNKDLSNILNTIEKLFDFIHNVAKDKNFLNLVENISKLNKKNEELCLPRENLYDKKDSTKNVLGNFIVEQDGDKLNIFDYKMISDILKKHSIPINKNKLDKRFVDEPSSIKKYYQEKTGAKIEKGKKLVFITKDELNKILNYIYNTKISFSSPINKTVLIQYEDKEFRLTISGYSNNLFIDSEQYDYRLFNNGATLTQHYNEFVKNKEKNNNKQIISKTYEQNMNYIKKANKTEINNLIRIILFQDNELKKLIKEHKAISKNLFNFKDETIHSKSHKISDIEFKINKKIYKLLFLKQNER